mmetsp:Transcript_31548/g.65616  ORF Transcript_31548/g.65616 Transcript_31548/m.65616 type:complete len:149 (+) Transcript_31548:1056-1502(+)
MNTGTLLEEDILEVHNADQIKTLYSALLLHYYILQPVPYYTYHISSFLHLVSALLKFTHGPQYQGQATGRRVSLELSRSVGPNFLMGQLSWQQFWWRKNAAKTAKQRRHIPFKLRYYQLDEKSESEYELVKGQKSNYLFKKNKYVVVT